MRYAHTNIISHDWKRLAQFYIDVFECEIVPPIRDQKGEWLSKGTGVPNAHLKGAHLRLPGHGANGPTLEIYEYSEVLELQAVAANQRGLGHLAFEVEDVHSIWQLAKHHGATTNGEIIKRSVSDLGEITFIYIRDPDGNLIELQSWKKQ